MEDQPKKILGINPGPLHTYAPTYIPTEYTPHTHEKKKRGKKKKACKIKDLMSGEPCKK